MSILASQLDLLEIATKSPDVIRAAGRVMRVLLREAGTGRGYPSVSQSQHVINRQASFPAKHQLIRSKICCISTSAVVILLAFNLAFCGDSKYQASRVRSFRLDDMGELNP